MRHALTCCVLAALALSTPAFAQSADAPAAAQAPQAPTPGMSLVDIVNAGWRSEANIARNVYRHPVETLRFFGLEPDDTVVEITPGGGWYAEVLAPYVRGSGKYVAAVVDPQALEEGRRDYQQRAKDGLAKRFAEAPAVFDQAVVVGYDPKAPAFGEAGSADVVLTFRNVHNWRSAGQAEGMFKGFYEVLKPGGVLGVVEHRANADVPADDKSGYVSEAQVIALAEAAGFKLDAKSEINANPKDTKDHPKGVWMLPPSNSHEPQDAAKYAAIGESDRMTLRFVKPRGE